jgi:signal transduction histidine kinase/CheY-like chemotaxis protein
VPLRHGVLAALIRYLRRTIPWVMGANLLGTLCLVVALWHSAPRDKLLWWIGTCLGYHVFMAVQFRFNHPLRYSPIPVAGLSLFWGAAFILFFPQGGPDQQFALLYTLALATAGTIFVSSLYFPILLAFVLPYTVIQIVMLLAQGTAMHAALAAGVVAFAALMMYFGWRVRALFIRTLSLRVENIELVSELTAQKEAAERANQAKSRFLAAANHDLRQPMHALNFYLGAMGGLELPPTVRPLLANGQVCARVMDDMFSQLLDVSRLDAAVLPAHRKPFAIAPVLQRLAVQLTPEAKAKGLRLAAAPCSAWIDGDEHLTERILRNFLANAIRYTARGKVLVGCRRRGACLHIGVYDTGIGIAPELHRAIFEEFYQAGNPERDHAKGLGLGLAIADRLAKLQGTQVLLQSEPGRGSVFALELPMVAAPLAAPMESDAVLRTSTAMPEQPCVLALDDDAMIRDAVAALLPQWGYAAVTAGGIEEAANRLAAENRVPALLVCDYRLHGNENGIEAVQRLREEFNADIPALLITAETAPERLQAIAQSGLPVLHKPLRPEALRQALDAALNGVPLTPAGTA